VGAQVTVTAYERSLALDVGDVVRIRRTSGVEQPDATVVEVVDNREYKAPELQTFRVEFRCVETGKMATRWCSAFDLLSDEESVEDPYDCQGGGW
jgi:hypothetical protein